MNPLISLLAIATLISAVVWSLTSLVTRIRFSKTLAKILVILGIILFIMSGWATPNASAKIHLLKEANQWVYQAEHVLSDDQHHLWEVMVLKSMEDHNPGLYLRIVTPSQQVHLDATQSLMMTTDLGQILIAPNVTSKQYIGDIPANNVGQYDIQHLLTDLKNARSLQLQIPTTSRTFMTLNIDSDILDEWIDVGTCVYLLSHCTHT